MKKMKSEYGEGTKAKVLLDVGGAIVIEPKGEEEKYSLRIVPSKDCNGLYFEVLFPNGEVRFRAGYDINHLYLTLKELAFTDGQEI